MADQIRIELEFDDDFLAKIYRLSIGSTPTVVPDNDFPGTFVALPTSTLIEDPNFPTTYTLSLGSTALYADPYYPGTFMIGSE